MSATDSDAADKLWLVARSGRSGRSHRKYFFIASHAKQIVEAIVLDDVVGMIFHLALVVVVDELIEGVQVVGEYFGEDLRGPRLLQVLVQRLERLGAHELMASVLVERVRYFGAEYCKFFLLVNW